MDGAARQGIGDAVTHFNRIDRQAERNRLQQHWCTRQRDVDQMQTAGTRSHGRNATHGIDGHVDAGAWQRQLSQHGGRVQPAGVDQGHAVAAGGHHRHGGRQTIQRRSHRNRFGSAAQRGNAHHTGGQHLAVERVLALLQLREVVQAVAVGVGAGERGADDALGHIGQAIVVTVRQAALAVWNHVGGNDARAVCVKRQVGDIQRGERHRWNDGVAPGLGADRTDIGHPVGCRVVHRQRVEGAGGQEDLQAPAGTSLTTDFSVARGDQVVGVGGQASHLGAEHLGRDLVQVEGLRVQLAVPHIEVLDGLQVRQLHGDFIEQRLQQRKRRIGVRIRRCRTGQGQLPRRNRQRRADRLWLLAGNAEGRGHLINHGADQRQAHALHALLGCLDQRVHLAQLGLDQRDSCADGAGDHRGAVVAVADDATAHVVQ